MGLRAPQARLFRQASPSPLCRAVPFCGQGLHGIELHGRAARSGVLTRSAAASFPLPNDDQPVNIATTLPTFQTDSPVTPKAPAELPIGFFDKVRALLFFAYSFILALPLFVTMVAMTPFVLAFDKFKRLALHFVNNLWAMASTIPFYGVKVVGRENLPPSNKPVVYVANHQSFMDIYSLFHLQRPFKFISKTSNFLIPIVGWSMFLTGHVMINRVDRRSQLECLKQCGQLLAQSAPVLFFPEGTRSKTRVMAGFKKGAFSVAVKAGVDVVPITLLGTGDVMPSGKENVMRAGQVTIVVHKPIPTKGRTADQVCNEAREVIASALPPELVGSASVMAPDES